MPFIGSCGIATEGSGDLSYTGIDVDSTSTICSGVILQGRRTGCQARLTWEQGQQGTKDKAHHPATRNAASQILQSRKAPFIYQELAPCAPALCVEWNTWNVHVVVDMIGWQSGLLRAGTFSIRQDCMVLI